MLGYIGLFLLVLGYATLLSSRPWLLVPINAVASIILVIYAFVIDDIPFIFVNGIVALILIATLIKNIYAKKQQHTEKETDTKTIRTIGGDIHQGRS